MSSDNIINAQVADDAAAMPDMSNKNHDGFLAQLGRRRQ